LGAGGLAIGLGFLLLGIGNYVLLSADLVAGRLTALDPAFDGSLALSVGIAIVGLVLISCFAKLSKRQQISFSNLCYATSLFLILSLISSSLGSTISWQAVLAYILASAFVLLSGFFLRSKGDRAKIESGVFVIAFGLTDLLRPGLSQLGHLFGSYPTPLSLGFLFSVRELEFLASIPLGLSLVFSVHRARISSGFAHLGIGVYAAGLSVTTLPLSLDMPSSIAGGAGDFSALILSLPRVFGIVLLMLGSTTLVIASVIDFKFSHHRRAVM
jgi:hypothetical protein